MPGLTKREADRRVNRMFDNAAKNNRRGGVDRRGLARGAALRGGAMRFMGPIGFGASLGLAGINMAQSRHADNIRTGGGINSPEVEKNRLYSVPEMEASFRNRSQPNRDPSLRQALFRMNQ